MASRLKEMSLENADDTEAWIGVFEATARTKKLKDSDGEKCITDYFLSTAGVDAVRKVSIMCHPKQM